MATFGFVVHPQRPQAAELVRDVSGWLVERGHEVRVCGPDGDDVGLGDLSVPVDEFVAGLDLCISLGGDGTMLRAVDLVAAHGIPLVGVNLGQLGYLTQCEPGQLRMTLKRFLAGSYDVEERMMLSVRVESASGDVAAGPHTALNEIVLEKTPMGHTVRVAVAIDGEPFTTYAADGLIVATPTGSTAYSLSARGPIVAPEHRALVMTPVSPHMLFDRSLVLEPDSVVRMEVTSDRPATVSVDGRNLGSLTVGDAVIVTGADVPARVLTIGSPRFHAVLKAKFGLEDR